MEFPERVGVMILGDCSLFPEALVPLFIFEPRYRVMLAEALESHRMFCLAMQKPDSEPECPCEMAGLGLVRASQLNDNGTSNLVLQGLTRIRLGKVIQQKPYRVHYIEPMPDQIQDPVAVATLADRLLDLVDARLRQGAVQVPVSMMSLLSGLCPGKEELTIVDCLSAFRKVASPGTLADMVAMLLLPNAVGRQQMLETPVVDERLAQLIQRLTREVARLQKKAQS